MQPAFGTVVEECLWHSSGSIISRSPIQFELLYLTDKGIVPYWLCRMCGPNSYCMCYALDLNLRNRLVQCCILSVAVTWRCKVDAAHSGSETPGKFRNVVLEKISCTSRVEIEEVFTYVLTHSLTACSTVLLEKLTGSQLVKKFPTPYETRRFLTAFTGARCLSLSWARSIQSITWHPTSWRSILILSSHLRWVSQVVSFPQISSPHQNPVYTFPLPHTCYMPIEEVLLRIQGKRDGHFT